jgi:flagellar biosynthesis activator protein FlaF
MHPSFRARSGYDSAATRTPRASEYAAFANVTHRMQAVDEADKAAFSALAQAVLDNHKLWGTLAEDLLQDGNQLPVPLRAQLLSLAEFVRKHSLAVLGGRASVAALIDINTAIMKGLRGETEAAA